MSKVTILDGGLSRELTRFGAELKQPEWSAGALITTPDAVYKTHEAFFEAGAKIATTASYAVVPFHIGWERFKNQGHELAAKSGQLARDAASAAQKKGCDIKVAGSLPPVCGSYVPEKFNKQEATEILKTLVHALEPYVDFWLAETLSSLEEIAVTGEAVKHSKKPLWISVSLEDEVTTDIPTLRSGEHLNDAISLIHEQNAQAIFFNCSLPEVMEDAVSTTKLQLQKLGINIPIGVYANGFAPQPRDGAANETLASIRPDLDPPAYLKWAEKWVDAGATLIGGCCGIGADHIATLENFFNPSHKEL